MLHKHLRHTFDDVFAKFNGDFIMVDVAELLNEAKSISLYLCSSNCQAGEVQDRKCWISYVT